MLFSALFVFFSVAFSLSFTLSFYFLYKNLTSTSTTNLHQKRQHKTSQNDTDIKKSDDPSLITCSLSEIVNATNKTGENKPTQLPHSLLLDISTLSEEIDPDCNQPGSGLWSGSGSGLDQNGLVVKKKRRRRGKKKKEHKDAELGVVEEEVEGVGSESGSRPGRVELELICLFPFTWSNSAMQRKIKRQYDQLMKCNESNGLTLAQVAEFANCLMDARTELQHKSEVTKRKFTITKVLLVKADRSAIDRLRQQLSKLESEYKRLEEDAFVYNWLQQQLTISPAYKTLIEIGAHMKAESDFSTENKDSEDGEISFEELLAQEKKDTFWLVAYSFVTNSASCSTVIKTCVLVQRYAGKEKGKRRPC